MNSSSIRRTLPLPFPIFFTFILSISSISRYLFSSKIVKPLFIPFPFHVLHSRFLHLSSSFPSTFSETLPSPAELASPLSLRISTNSLRPSTTRTYNLFRNSLCSLGSDHADSVVFDQTSLIPTGYQRGAAALTDDLKAHGKQTSNSRLVLKL